MKRTIALTLMAALLSPSLTWAQAPDQTDTVRAIRAQVIASGIDIDASECSRFLVTNRVAAKLEVAYGAGLHYKPTGNNCRERSVDVIQFKDGSLVDILGAGPEGPNSPHWMVLSPVDPATWREPYPVDDPTPTPVPVPEPTPVPPPTPLPAVDLSLILSRLDALQAELKAHEVVEEAHWSNAKNAFYQAMKYLAPIIGGIVLGKTAIK